MGDCVWVISSVDWHVPYLMEKRHSVPQAPTAAACAILVIAFAMSFVLCTSTKLRFAQENRCGEQRCQAPFRVVWKNKRGSFRENSGCHPQMSIVHNRNAGNDKQGTARTRDKE